MFRVKRVQLAFTEYARQTYIYEKSTVRLTSVGLAQARPNYIYVSYVVPHILNLSNLTYVASISANATCSTMESYSNSSARVPESSGNREDRLQRRRERERARRASETAEQREERLRVRRARDRLDAPLRLPKRETPDCGKYAITDVKVWQLKVNRREQLGFSR